MVGFVTNGSGAAGSAEWALKKSVRLRRSRLPSPGSFAHRAADGRGGSGFAAGAGGTSPPAVPARVVTFCYAPTALLFVEDGSAEYTSTVQERITVCIPETPWRLKERPFPAPSLPLFLRAECVSREARFRRRAGEHRGRVQRKHGQPMGGTAGNCPLGGPGVWSISVKRSVGRHILPPTSSLRRRPCATSSMRSAGSGRVHHPV